MQIAEQIGSTFANACIMENKGSRKYPVAVPITVNPSCNDYAPMELGTTATFLSKYQLCGRLGHKAVQCNKGKPPATCTSTNCHTEKGKL